MGIDPLNLAERALSHFREGSTDQSESLMKMPIDAYTDPDRYKREVNRIFLELPMAAALSIEIPNAGDYKAMTVSDVPILLVRGKDKVVRAFLNVCRHRGSKLCPDGSGTSRVFSCPYHAWTYGHLGELVGRYGSDTFGDIEAKEYGLTGLACEEQAGLIWTILSPKKSFDAGLWLGDFKTELESLQLDSWVLHEQRELPGPGWKVAMDGYLEAYHHQIVHGRTVGKHTVGNLLVLDTFGPHQLLTFARKSIGSLADIPRKNWEPMDHIRLIHSCFPNLSISGILGGQCLVSQIFPGPTPETTVTRQSILAAPSVDEESVKIFSKMTLEAVRDEDYKIGLDIQSSIHAGANDHFVFGKNEPAVQNYHKWISNFMESETYTWS